MQKPVWECTHYAYLECTDPRFPPKEIYLIADKRNSGYAIGVRPCQPLDHGQTIIINTPVSGIFSELSDAIRAFEKTLRTREEQGYEEKSSRIGHQVQLANGDLSVHISPNTFELRALATEGPTIKGTHLTTFSLLNGDGWFVPFTRVVIAQTSLPDLKILSGVELVVLVQCNSFRRGCIEISSFTRLLPAEEKELCRFDQLAQLP